MIAFVDFGMVGTITRHMKRAFKDSFLGFVTSDAHVVTDALLKLGFIGEGANIVAIERAMAMMLEQYHGMTLGQFREMDMGDIAQDVGELLYGQPFRIPAQFAFTGRAVSTLVGVTTGLAPDFNFVEVATPYARHFLGLNANGAGEALGEIAQQLLDTGRVLMTLPRTLERLVTRIEAGQVEIKLANFPVGKGAGRGRSKASATSLIGGGVGTITQTLMFIASLGGGVYLMNAHIAIAGWFCLGLSAVLALGTLVKR